MLDNIITHAKDIFYRTEFDFNKPDLKLFDFHPQLRLAFVIQGLFFKNQDSNLRFIWPFICVGLSVVGNVFELFYVYYSMSKKDYAGAVESLAYTIILTITPFIYGCTLMNKSEIFTLLQRMDTDFIDIGKMHESFRKEFMKGQLKIWHVLIIWTLFIFFGFCGYVFITISSLLYMSLFATVDEHMTRPLVFPLWIPTDDVYRTPNYEIFLGIEILLLVCFISTFGFYVYILFHILLHNLTLLRMVGSGLTMVFEGVNHNVVGLDSSDQHRIDAQVVLNKRFKRIITWHDSVFKLDLFETIKISLTVNNYNSFILFQYTPYSTTLYNLINIHALQSIYGPVLFYQVMFSSAILCLLTYLAAEQIGTGAPDIMIVFLIVGCCIQLWIPCYLGSILECEGYLLIDKCFQCGWHKTPLSVLVRAHVGLILMRAQKPILIKISGVPGLTLMTFSSIMRTAYSYFNMLQQRKV